MNENKGCCRKFLIKNGTVVNSDSIELTDVVVEDGKISKVGRGLAVPEGGQVIDAAGKYVLPGGIDTHTHLDFAFMGTRTKDDFYTGTRAAVAGGTTMIIDFAIPQKGESLIDAYKHWRSLADGKVVCDYGLHLAVTWWSPQVEQEMEILCRDHGVNSFKMFMAYKGSFMVDDGQLYKAFEACERLGALPMVHAENGHLVDQNTNKLLNMGIVGPEGHEMSRPENVEEEATKRACVVAENVGSALYVVHVMSESAAGIIAEHRRNGNKRIFGETLAASVGTTFPENSDFKTAAAHIMSPPIRAKKSTPTTLIKHLAAGDLQTTGSDNCTFDISQKAMGESNFSKIPNGVNGVEDRMSVLWTKGVGSGLLTPKEFVAVTSTNAAKIFNIYPRKGAIREGSDADLVVWDPALRRVISATTHHHNTDFNIFEGMEVVGSPETVIVAGKVCFESGSLYTVKGFGSFVPTPCFSTAVFNATTALCDKSQTVLIPEFIEPKNLNYQDKAIAINAINKVASKLNLAAYSDFKKKDSTGRGRFTRKEFQIALHDSGLLGMLSSREIDVLMRGYGPSNTQGNEIIYSDLLKAGEFQYRSQRGGLPL